MTRPTYLTHATVVRPDELLADESVLIEDGHIASIGGGATPTSREVDLRGAYLLPGVIDLHCDALEKELEPRPGVLFPADFAIDQSDRRNAVAGITTPVHAIAFAQDEFGVRSHDTAATLVRRLRERREGLMVNHAIHARYEVTDTGAVNLLLDLLDGGHIDVLSFMDHTPGQGQYPTDESLQVYMQRNYERTKSESQAMIAGKRARRETAGERMDRLAAKCVERGVTLASHDDDSESQVRAMSKRGATISEFPIDLGTAQFAHESGFATMFGAPNVLRGRSQGNGMRALDAVEAGVISLLCSDYHPGTLLPAVFKIADTTSWSLPQAVRLVTDNAAQALGWTDRGSVDPGRRADLIVVDAAKGRCDVRAVWVGARPVWARGDLASES